MSILKGLKKETGIKGDTDSLGGNRVLNSGLYDLVIKVAYLSVAKSEAVAMNIIAEHNGKTIRQQFWMTSGKEKGCKPYFEKDGVKQYLPGFLMANALCQLTVGKEVGDLETEKKVIKLYDYDLKAEKNTEVEAWTDLTGVKVTAGIIKQTVDKNTKATDPVTGKDIYVPSGETREENEIDKLFHAELGMTISEIEQGATAPKFKDEWNTQWAGKVKNKAKGAAKDDTKTGSPSAQRASTSMFANA